MKLEEFSNKVDSFLNQLPSEMERVSVIMGNAAIPLITNRLINEGKTAEGKSLGTYSNTPISALFFIGKSVGSGAEKAVSDYAKKNGGKLSYEKFRQLNSRPTSHVTLSLTGETLQDIGILGTRVDGNKLSTRIGSLDRRSKDVFYKGKKIGVEGTGEVLEKLNDKYGSALDTELLALSQEEQKLLAGIYEQRLQKIINDFFL